MKKFFLTLLIFTIALLGVNCKCYEHSIIPPVETIIPQEIEEIPTNDIILIPSPQADLIEYNVGVINPGISLCGGTVVRSTKDETLVLTAAHCIMFNDKTPMEYGFVEFNDDNKYRVIVIDYSRQQDLALLRITDPIELKEVTFLALEAPVSGDHIWVLGYGAKIEDLMSDGIVGKADVMHIYYKKRHCIIIDASATGGNSGGGIYNDYNELVGVLQGNGPQNPVDGMWNYAAHLDEIKKFLEKWL